MHNDLVLPISVKGVLGPPGQVVLLHNERGEWELPGGRIETDDASPPIALQREIAEELDLIVTVGRPVHSWRYRPIPHREVLLIAYACAIVGEWPASLAHSAEHDRVGVFGRDDLGDLALPQGYRDAIALAP